MKALVQRVAEAAVGVEGAVWCRAGPSSSSGLKRDSKGPDYLLKKVARLRIFADDQKR
jgi:D-Tyr-tRNAtyr deacylase